jgi:hypothetical protein
MKILRLKKSIKTEAAELLKGTFLDDSSYDIVINEDCDAYDLEGKMLFRFRKNVIPFDLLKKGYESFKGSIELTEGRGIASGGSFKRIRKDGSVSNTTVGNKVYSGVIGFMDSSAMVRYCRKTSFSRSHFDKFKEGVPFVEFIDKKYKELCPEHYKKQMNISIGTNKNYRIGETSFTTVTVNKNFQTAVHKDSGDFSEGFGNLSVYREGDYEGSYFCLPEYRAAIDMRNCDILFADVHRWHGNTPFRNMSDDYLRIAFVMYYREYMYLCKQPKDELLRVKVEQTGFLKL